MTTAGIRNQILKVIASDPPEWVKQKLQPSVSTDALDRSASGSLKDVISSVLEEYRGKEVSCKQIVKEKFYEKPVNVCETGKLDEHIVETKSRKKNSDQKAYPSTELIIERCRNVLQDVTSAEKFAQLCNLVHGSFAGSRTHDVFDFRLIELRMNAGTYGMSPTLFDSDMQQIWKRVREIGQEMIFLADGLTEYSQASYKKQVVTLLEEDVDPEIDDMNMTMRASINEVAVDNDILNEQPQRTIDSHHIIKQNSKMSEIPRSDVGNAPCVSSKKTVDDNGRRLVGVAEVELKDTPRNAHLSSKKTLSMRNTDGHGNGCLEHKQDGVLNVIEVGSSGSQVQCTSCGSNEHNNCIIACNKCQAAYHIYCLSPPLEVIPSTSWYCSCCSAVGKESFQVHSSSDGKAKMVKEDMNNTAHDVLVSDLEGGPVEMHIAHENGKLDTSREQVQSESNMEECGPQIHVRMVGIQEDMEEIGLHINETETPFHGSKEDSELHDDRLVAKACKICTTGTRDDDHLIQCSNENCLYKFYHLRCLRPPLASIPPPTWYCPSCLCRSCFMDENDDYIVLCDGCDDAYHTYCLKPPLTSIPENNWYCPTCLEKQKRRKGKKVLNPKESAGKLRIQVRSKKASQMQNQSSLQLNKATDLSERTPGSVGQVCSKNSSQIASPLYMHRGPHDFTDKSMKGEMESAVQHEQSQKASQLANSVVEEVAGEASSDASLDDVTENFIVRVRPRHTTKYKTGSESKDAAKRKRKCSEPRRSEV
uniref:PHD-type domain-containing protein n=1 Tax=Araucaria cunninghamii TaxID=56994 RepID=A0A0D6R4Z0_ARACU